MSILTSTPTAWQWPPDVLEFAARNKVDGYLEPLRDALRDLFPKARTFTVYLDDDPEIRDDWHITFEVNIATAEVPDFVAAKRRWHEALFRICPAPLVCIFRLFLVPEDE